MTKDLTMNDISCLLRVESMGYRWCIAKSNTDHYVCRIWQDKVVNKRYTRTLYVGAFGNSLQDTINECWEKFKEKIRT